MEKRKFLIIVLRAKLNKKGQPSFLTRWRIRRATKLGVSMRRSELDFRYVLVPHHTAAAKEATHRLLMELATQDPAYEGSYLTPELGMAVPSKSQVDFARDAAVKAGAKFVVA